MNAVRRAIESMYDSTCTVKEFQSVRDPVTQITSKKEIVVLENQPCKLSYEKQMAASNTSAPAIIAQSTKLFLAPEITVKAGSKIIVTKNSKSTEYSRSGEPAVYTNHQEIMLELFKGYA
ncbi:hypothetical protein [Bacillus sp. S/N-304-OC-R1]|uniref:hypothetical protein n=1 Tax=Bacillus sp. S/N-304-OC-R1 TaxID=2758034 RepID=UPI001C8E2623|nr:hypothetical protein [Bacillus sp. S/N-304-OC-R1]MBY0122157.1 hypothetical protein [Bacillus sp. S/N-304-OC-R1]